MSPGSQLNWDFILKFVIVGDSGVGKSSLLVRFTDDRFLQAPDPTIGVEFGSRIVEIPESGKRLKLQCWDTAGQESFRSLTRSYYRGAAGSLLVYNPTSRASFASLPHWLADVRQHADENLSTLIVANKCDLPEEDWEVPSEEGRQWAKEMECGFLEVSARTGVGVEEAFDKTAREILEKIRAGVFDRHPPAGIKSADSRAKLSGGLQLSDGQGAGGSGCCGGG